jgi:transposase
MELAYRRCCGMDAHRKSISVCVLPPVGSGAIAVKHEMFRTFTRDLKRLRVWLLRCMVTEIVMESTRQYWRPVWNILEGAFPRRRLERDDLKGSFIPPRDIRELRDLTRLRVHWLQDFESRQDRIGQLCESGKIKLSSVTNNLFGVSGRRILPSLAFGQRDAGWMADYAHVSLRGTKYQLELALQGTFTDHQRSVLARLLEQMNTLEQRRGTDGRD